MKSNRFLINLYHYYYFTFVQIGFEQSAHKAEEAHKSIHLPENRIHVEHCQTNMFLSKTDYNYTLRKSEGDEERAGK